MPKFLLSIAVLSIVSLIGFGCVILKLSPDQTISVPLFLITFFLSLTFTLSLVFFFLHTPHLFSRRKGAGFRPKTFDAFGPLVTDDDLRPLFRTSLRRATLVALLATTLLVLQRLR